MCDLNARLQARGIGAGGRVVCNLNARLQARGIGAGGWLCRSCDGVVLPGNGGGSLDARLQARSIGAGGCIGRVMVWFCRAMAVAGARLSARQH